MFIHEREALKDVIQALRGRLHGKIVSAHAFGSRVRGSHDEWSDFDLLVVVDGRTTALEQEVIGIIVEEEMKKGSPSRRSSRISANLRWKNVFIRRSTRISSKKGCRYDAFMGRQENTQSDQNGEGARIFGGRKGKFPRGAR